MQMSADSAITRTVITTSLKSNCNEHEREINKIVERKETQI